jgi:hypothetical protein
MTRRRLFVVSPRPSLIAIAEVDGPHLLERSYVISVETGGRRILPYDDDKILVDCEIKVFFLAMLLSWVSGWIDNDDQEIPPHLRIAKERGERNAVIVRGLLGAPPYTAATFDKWWTVVEGGSRVHVLEEEDKRIDRGVWKMIDGTTISDKATMLLNEWIEELRQAPGNAQ